MDSTPVTALKELRIDTSIGAAPFSTDTESELPVVEVAQLSPKLDRVRHHLIPARTNTCVRAPCLKRQASVPISSISLDLASARRGSASVQDRVASNPLPTSFAAPRNLVLQSASRHVHFDDAPPEEFFVLSGASYDRRPIKCTQGGSEFDMSLPPRCKSYNGDDSNDDDASSTDGGPITLESAEEPAPDVGFFHDPTLENWACIKNGTVIASVGYQPRQQQSGLMASGKSLHFSALSSSQHASALNGGADPSLSYPETQPEATSQKVSLPVHGFRSFGGLQNSLAPKTAAAAAVAAPVQPVASPKQAPSTEETTPPSVRKLSPDATPMPSPSLHKSIGAFTSVSYFASGSSCAQSSSTADSKHTREAPSKDMALSSENALGIMEVLRDEAANASSNDTGRDFRVNEPSLSYTSTSSPSGIKPARITVNVPEATARSTPRRMGLERRMADKDAVRISSLHPSASVNGGVTASSSGWSNLLGVTSSPLSSRCSSVDPWSSLSSDGDGDGTESPCNETSWISSNCTSPDLSPFEQAAEGFSHKNGSHPPVGSTPSWLEARSIKHVDSTSTLSNGGSSYAKAILSDAERELNTPKSTDLADETKFSSSVETVSTMSWEHKRLTGMVSSNLLGGISSGDVSTSEATTPESSRRPSFHHNDVVSHRLSPSLRTGFADHDSSAIDTLDEDDSHMLRVRSHSRDGHAKKKSTKCRYCRSLRQRIKNAGTESSAPTSSGGSAQITDAEEDAEGKGGYLSLASAAVSLAQHDSRKVSADLPGSTEVSEMEDEDAQRSSVRSLSMDEWSSNASRSRSRDRSALSRVSATMEAQHDRESSNSPAESCSESPRVLAVNLPTECTCDKKREKERMKKKMRKERELERERDREWERDQARGRQKKLFGESFGDADTSCLSALDGF
ncbi:hypothetical protein EX895_005564 [Sporisorium graminicola]|uniref:Uncharacterized protein n=1 Tax=Sporisorium graminicola TaxID=280036 RepID=A0A4U7KQY7_9BASI|nr:hypothetical protein EX895_005564 [Sporisorium graminicola]TKY85402.1 hypothetical protein EX895_005564 [Sporisorium graminicola]